MKAIDVMILFRCLYSTDPKVWVPKLTFCRIKEYVYHNLLYIYIYTQSI